VVIGVGLYFNRYKFVKVDPNNLPQFIQHDFVDLSKIYSISKFRSGEGHSFTSKIGEQCRSLKHYFTPQFDPNQAFRTVDGQQLPALPDGITDRDIFSPVDGKIVQIAEEHTPIGKQLYIVPDSHPEFTIRIFHVYPKDGLTAGTAGLGGTHVTAGEKLGVIAKSQGTDISVEYGAKQNFVSYFQVMPDSVFAAYEARGVASRDDFIISKEYRDAHPLQCNGEQFVHEQNYDNSQDDVHLSGYVDTQSQYQQMQQDRAQNPQKYMQGNNGSNNGTNNNSGY
jgi:hypothetical protein